MKLRAVLQRNHSIDDVLLQDLVRVAADLVKALSCLIDLLIELFVVDAWLVVISISFVGIHSTIKYLACIVIHIVLVLSIWWSSGISIIGVLLRIRRSLIVLFYTATWHGVQLNKATHHVTALIMDWLFNLLPSLLLLLDRLSDWLDSKWFFSGFADCLTSILLLLDHDFNEDTKAVKHVILLLDNFVDSPDRSKLSVLSFVKLFQEFALSRGQISSLDKAINGL